MDFRTKPPQRLDWAEESSRENMNMNMKIKIQIKNWYTGNVLFEFEKENNTVCETLKEAINSEADLTGADLTGAYLTGANLTRVNLTRANFTGANLTGADFTRTNLTEANFTGANLTGVNLTEANLTRANFTGANLTGADFTGAKNAELVQAQTIIVGEGTLIGWKKCQDGLLIKLRIPEEAKRSNATGRKCRAEFADVLEIIDSKDTLKKITKAVSRHDNQFIYRVGERVTPTIDWSNDRFDECASGIHFFITRLEAENYN